jgi:hypothetical protein
VSFDPRAQPVRFSTLKRIAQSPAHYRAALEPDESSDSLALRLGSGVHALLLGGAEVALWTGPVRRGKAWDEFESAHADRIILNQREHDEARGIADAVLACDDARRLLLDGTRLEERITAELDGRAIVGRPDAYGPCHVVDLKTSRNAAPSKFLRDAQWRGYHAQLAWYGDLLTLAGKARVTDHYLVAVETHRPYVVVAYQATPQAIDLGRRQYRLWWEQLRACEQADAWPGYASSIVEWDVAEDVEILFDE